MPVDISHSNRDKALSSSYLVNLSGSSGGSNINSKDLVFNFFLSPIDLLCALACSMFVSSEAESNINLSVIDTIQAVIMSDS